MTASPSVWVRRVHGLLSGRQAPGVYRLVTLAPADKIVNAARAAGWSTWTVAGAPATKADLLHSVEGALHLPDWFGRNWDALADALTELADESDGGLLVWPGAEALADASPDDWATACAVFDGAIAYHREHGWSFAVVCIGRQPPTSLPNL
jgi:hypothetical protein